VRRLVPIALALVVAVGAGGCGSDDGRSTVSQTTKNLAKIQSGVLDLRLMVTPRSGEPFGFRLKGPFSLRPGKLPVARVAYTQTANGQSATATFVSDGAHAWVVANGVTTPLSEAQASSLRTSTKALGGDGGGLSTFDVGAWIDEPEVSDGGEGADRVTGELDVVAAANGLMGLASLAGRNGSEIEGADADRLRQATRASSVELLTGKDDRLLRRLRLSADLGFDVPQSLKQALGTRVGAKIDFLLAVGRPNTPVEVKGP
jgi:hypothetical protein